MREEHSKLPFVTQRDVAVGDGDGDYDEQRSYCPTCGNEMDWVDCWNGCDDGWFDEYEINPIEALPGELSRCDVCNGDGGYLVCPVCHPDALE